MKSLHKKIRSLPVSEHQIRMTTSGGRHRKANRLVNEKSPYLLQHAYNPVDWYPWGEEAFQKARKESKLIFLSVGYSTCHWCHVMEKESFENDDIAKELNKHFVSIKVDREERPDVDKVYMSFIQATSGRGGWPMSVWLTPSLKPYTGGTYFPPSDTAWRKGFKTILGMVTHKWKQDKAACNASANRIMNLIKKSSENLTDPHQTNPTLTSCDKCARQLVKSFDAEHGGFGGAPKFPQPVNMNFLLRYSTCNPDTDLGRQSLGAVKHTLEMMANGGIHDHIGFGFHRYSTDERWHVPHFEKMLYDQGQLACAYADCYALTKEDKFRRSLRSILEYVERDLTHPDGGFYSAEDADSLSTRHDSEKKEGAFYAWTSDEIDEVLGADMIQPAISLADIFKYFYSVRRSGNVSFEQDPHGDLRGKNVLMSSPSVVEQCTDKFGVGADALVDAIETARGKLFRARDRRPRPHLDNKMITAWNGLMISGFAKASTVLGSRHYKQVATSAANFVRNHLYDSRSGFLLRSCYCDQDDLSLQQVLRPIAGYDSDYAFFIRSLIDLFEATSDADWLEWANDLQERQLELFWDEANGAFFSTTLHDPSILLRMKDDQDGAEPASNSVSSHNLLRLAAYLDRSDFRTKAEQLVRCFSDRLRQMPHALPEMAASVLWMSHGHKQIIIKGDPEDSEMKKMIKFINSNFIPNKVVIPANVERSPFLYRHLEDRLRAMDGGRLGVYVCEDFACRLPAANLRELKRSLRFTRASSSGGDETNITPWS